MICLVWFGAEGCGLCRFDKGFDRRFVTRGLQYHSCGLSSSNTVFCWGQNGNGQVLLAVFFEVFFRFSEDLSDSEIGTTLRLVTALPSNDIRP